MDRAKRGWAEHANRKVVDFWYGYQEEKPEAPKE